MPQAGIEPTTNTLLSVGRSRTIDQLSQNLDWKTIETDTTPTEMLKIRFFGDFLYKYALFTPCSNSKDSYYHHTTKLGKKNATKKTEKR